MKTLKRKYCYECKREIHDRDHAKTRCDNCQHRHYQAYFSRSLMEPSDRGVLRALRGLLSALVVVLGVGVGYASASPQIGSQCIVKDMPVEMGRNAAYKPMGGVDGCWIEFEAADGITYFCQYRGGEVLCD